MSELEEDTPSVEELLSLILIQQMRNYDVMIHLLKHFDEESAVTLHEMHSNLETWGPFPFSVE